MDKNLASVIIKLLDVVVLGITLPPEIMKSYNDHKLKLDEMIKEGRDPNKEEWEELINSINSSSQKFSA